MEISDIQLENNKVEITFYNSETMEDVMTIRISKKDAQWISSFCREELSYGAKLKLQGSTKYR